MNKTKRFEGKNIGTISADSFYDYVWLLIYDRAGVEYRMNVSELKDVLKHFSFEITRKRIHPYLEEAELSGFEGNVLKTTISGLGGIE